MIGIPKGLELVVTTGMLGKRLDVGVTNEGGKVVGRGRVLIIVVDKGLLKLDTEDIVGLKLGFLEFSDENTVGIRFAGNRSFEFGNEEVLEIGRYGFLLFEKEFVIGRLLDS